MTHTTLDLLFPWIVFGYGTLLSLVLNSRRLMDIAEEKLPVALYTQLNAHRWLAAASVVIGAIWILQNIWVKDQLFVLVN